MDLTVIFGVFIGISLLFYSIGIETGIRFFYDVPSIMIVLGGTLGAVLVHFPFNQLKGFFSRLKVIFSFKRYNYQADIEYLVSLSKKSHSEGRMALSSEISKIEDHFLRHGLQLLVDRVSAEELEVLLQNNLEYMLRRHDIGVRVFEQMAKYAPSFGLLGTLIGLILMLGNLNDPKSLGPNMSVALVTTFYGVILSSLIFLPLAGRLRIASNEEMLQKKMLIQGLLAIARGDTSYLVREKMSMLLPQKERKLHEATPSNKGH